MAELRLGGRCQRHPLNILPCEKCAVEQPQILTLRDVLHRLHALIGDGTQKAAAERLGVSQQYLSDVLNEAREPGPLILAGLGIERVVTYRTVGVTAIDGPRRGPVADGSQTPNDAAAIPRAKAGSNTGTAGVAERHPRCGYPYCACVGECFAASQPAAAAGVKGDESCKN